MMLDMVAKPTRAATYLANRAPFFKLQRACVSCRFENSCRPPWAIGLLWSTCHSLRDNPNIPKHNAHSPRCFAYSNSSSLAGVFFTPAPRRRAASALLFGFMQSRHRDRYRPPPIRANHPRGLILRHNVQRFCNVSVVMVNSLT